jgi:hypothetical protein
MKKSVQSKLTIEEKKRKVWAGRELAPFVLLQVGHPLLQI